MNVELELDEVERLLDLLRDYRRSVEKGELVGYGQSVEDELSDVDALMDKLS